MAMHCPGFTNYCTPGLHWQTGGAPAQAAVSCRAVLCAHSIMDAARDPAFTQEFPCCLCWHQGQTGQQCALGQ